MRLVMNKAINPEIKKIKALRLIIVTRKLEISCRNSGLEVKYGIFI